MGEHGRAGSDVALGLMCFVEPDGGAGWVNPVTGGALRLAPNGVYHVSRRTHDGYEQDVILGQMSVGETTSTLAAPSATETRRRVYELIRIVDGSDGADGSDGSAPAARGA